MFPDVVSHFSSGKKCNRLDQGVFMEATMTDKHPNQFPLRKLCLCLLLASLWLSGCTRPTGIAQEHALSPTPTPQPSPRPTLKPTLATPALPTLTSSPTSTFSPPRPKPTSMTTPTALIDAVWGHLIFFGSDSDPLNIYIVDAKCLKVRWKCEKEWTKLTNVGAHKTADNFTPHLMGDFAPAPDGKQVAFAVAAEGSGYSGTSDIYVIDVDLCTRTPGGCVLEQLRRLTHNDVYDGNPAWSPNGDWIVFETWRNHKRLLYKIRPDGADEQPFLTEEVTREVGDTVDAPVWSPDGSRLAFSMWDQAELGSVSSIVVVDKDGANLRMLLPAPKETGIGDTLLQRALAWSPDGRLMLVSTYTDSNWDDNAVMNADGTNIRKLPREIDLLTWLPDSQHVLFSCYNDEGPIGTCIMNINTGETDQIGSKRWFGAKWMP